eukprot:TRINITY_DN10537_c0_g1_i2.p1 TRINITY_DN10537_c0_g1~~TRINITY_DN10537_c0_g1_i2.p1  ORF type:complete len:413 (-),score=84.82 TRINITY_DN10537_c0_g1_i2:166-1347(-)
MCIRDSCTGGELLERVIQDGQLSEYEAARVMSKIFHAVSYLHSRKICHRDLKPENFLFSDKTPDSEIKIIDFGLSKRIGKEDEKGMSTLAGTPLYVAPEVLQGSYNHQCDNWSLGVTLYVLLCGQPPFYAEDKGFMFKQILSGRFNFNAPEWKSISKNAMDLITKLLVLNPESRITAEQALQHPWFNEFEEKKKLKQKMIDKNVIDLLKQYSFATRFKREALRVFAGLMTETDLKQLNDAFREMDKDGTGLIHVWELKEAMRSLGYTDTQEEINKIVIQMSYGESHQINYRDFIAATLAQEKFLTKEKVWAIFKHFDTDNTNSITKENHKEAMARMGRRLPEETIDEMISMLDMNHDGNIYFEDFYTMMMTSDKTSHTISSRDNETKSPLSAK